MTENYRLPENAEASIVGCLLLCPDTKLAIARLVSERDFAYYAADEAPLNPWESVAMELIVRKNRHGRSFGICSAGFFPATGKIIREMSR